MGLATVWMNGRPARPCVWSGSGTGACTHRSPTPPLVELDEFRLGISQPSAEAGGGGIPAPRTTCERAKRLYVT